MFYMILGLLFSILCSVLMVTHLHYSFHPAVAGIGFMSLGTYMMNKEDDQDCSKPRIVREQVGLPDRSLQFKNIDEGYRVFFKVFTTVLQHLLLSLVLQDQRDSTNAIYGNCTIRYIY